MGDHYYPYEENADAIRDLARVHREKGDKIVLTGGTFDVERPTPVHVAYLRECKNRGDVLFVNVTNDARTRLAKEAKGQVVPRPYFSEGARVYHVASIDAVDYAVVHPYVGNPLDSSDVGPTERLAKVIHPDIIIKGIQKDNEGWRKGERKMLTDFLGFRPKYDQIRVEGGGISSTGLLEYAALFSVNPAAGS